MELRLSYLLSCNCRISFIIYNYCCIWVYSFNFIFDRFLASGVKLAGSLTAVLSAGLTMSLPAFGLVVASGDLSSKSVAGITAVLPSGL